MVCQKLFYKNIKILLVIYIMFTLEACTMDNYHNAFVKQGDVFVKHKLKISIYFDKKDKYRKINKKEYDEYFKKFNASIDFYDYSSVYSFIYTDKNAEHRKLNKVGLFIRQIKDADYEEHVQITNRARPGDCMIVYKIDLKTKTIVDWYFRYENDKYDCIVH